MIQQKSKNNYHLNQIINVTKAATSYLQTRWHDERWEEIQRRKFGGGNADFEYFLKKRMEQEIRWRKKV